MSNTPAQQLAVTIRVAPSNAAAFEGIVCELQRAGLADVQVHPRFGIVNGHASPAAIDLLREIPGVTSVREDRQYGVR